MDWHKRYVQQASWTRDLRFYLFERAGLIHARRVLEVGCGTGAVLSGLPDSPSIHGIDIDRSALAQSRLHAPAATLVQGDALHLPYADALFEIVYCHFLLLWVADPLQVLLEMKRVSQAGGHILAFAEPDYTARHDEPPELLWLGEWQTAALRRQGADPELGRHLGDLFFRAGIRIVETGPLQNVAREFSPEDWDIEWAVLESDLAGSVGDKDLEAMKHRDEQARRQGKRVLDVPTYFAWGRT